jgi:type IV pilus assembly protein PilQ
VVPQICNDNYVNLILYPSVTSSTNHVDATSLIDTTTSTDSYPIIDVRETQTQVLLNNGETIAIGGLLQDQTSTSVIKTPIIGDIPWLGKLFQRKTSSTTKVDLIIFITVQIVDASKQNNASVSAALSQDITKGLQEKKDISAAVVAAQTMPSEGIKPVKAQERAQEKPEMTSTTTAVTTQH